MLSPTVGKHGLKKESDERRARAARGERSQHAEAAARGHTRHPGGEGQGGLQERNPEPCHRPRPGATAMQRTTASASQRDEEEIFQCLHKST